jgi:hypothetical protein
MVYHRGQLHFTDTKWNRIPYINCAWFEITAGFSLYIMPMSKYGPSAFAFWLQTLASEVYGLVKAVFRYAGTRPQDEGTLPHLLLQLLLSNYTVQLQCLRRAPGRSVTEQRQLVHTNCRSGRDRGSNPGCLSGTQTSFWLLHPLQLHV